MANGVSPSRTLRPILLAFLVAAFLAGILSIPPLTGWYVGRRLRALGTRFDAGGEPRYAATVRPGYLRTIVRLEARERTTIPRILRLEIHHGPFFFAPAARRYHGRPRFGLALVELWVEQEGPDLLLLRHRVAPFGRGTGTVSFGDGPVGTTFASRDLGDGDLILPLQARAVGGLAFGAGHAHVHVDPNALRTELDFAEFAAGNVGFEEVHIDGRLLADRTARDRAMATIEVRHLAIAELAFDDVRVSFTQPGDQRSSRMTVDARDAGTLALDAMRMHLDLDAERIDIAALASAQFGESSDRIVHGIFMHAMGLMTGEDRGIEVSSEDQDEWLRAFRSGPAFTSTMTVDYDDGASERRLRFAVRAGFDAPLPAGATFAELVRRAHLEVEATAPTEVVRGVGIAAFSMLSMVDASKRAPDEAGMNAILDACVVAGLATRQGDDLSTTVSFHTGESWLRVLGAPLGPDREAPVRFAYAQATALPIEISLEGVAVQGGLSIARVSAILATNAEGFRQCVRTTTAAIPGVRIEGAVPFRLRIGADGTPRDVTLATRERSESPTADCLRAHLATVTFPAADRGSDAAFTLAYRPEAPEPSLLDSSFGAMPPP